MNYKVSIIRLFSYSVILLTAFFFALPMKAQVEIGDNAKNPQAYSLMEVATSRNKGGLRLPQLKTAQRSALNAQLIANPDAAQGLVIFNIDTYCVEYWSVDHWVSLCDNEAEIFFTIPNGDPHKHADWIDPTATVFLPEGSTSDPFVPHGTPECTSVDPPYTLTVKLGDASIAPYTTVTGAFTIAMPANPSLGMRYAIINVKDNCTNLSKDFLFTQAGKCISPPDQPSIITGDTVVGVNSTGYNGAGLTYSVTNVPGVTYTWLLPAGWMQTGGGQTNSITVNVGPTRGTGTITVIPSNDCGIGAPSTLTVKISCGAYITGSASSPVWKEFMCWNLGADYAADPLVPSQSLHGAKYKWGLATLALNVADDQNQSNNAGFGAAWTTAAYGIPPTGFANWDMTTANPCPAGFRVPSISEMSNLQANNGTSAVRGSSSGTGPLDNYTAGIYIGNSLFLPAAGARDYQTGPMNQPRGGYGFYWTSTASATFDYMGTRIYFYPPDGTIYQSNAQRDYGYSIRCVAQ